MVATQHSRSGSRSQDGGRSAEIAAVERLLGQAADFELRAPELALVLGERAAALAEAAGAEELWVRGEGLAVSARVRLGLRAPTVGRAVAALRAAEDTGQTTLAAQLRTDLAVCARSVGAPLTGLAALRPVLDAAGFGGARKAAALSQLVGCLAQFGRKLELDRTLAEADRLCGADDDLDGDGRLLARSLLRVAVSAHRRRHGDVIGAADAARTGLGFLEQLEDAQHDGGVVRIRLVLQLVCSLLDRGDGTNALDLAQPVLDEPARAASVAPAGWLRMAIATRVLLPSGSVEAAARMLRDAVHATERHELHALTARLWTELAHVEERLGRYAEAIECLQLARAAEHIHARARRQAIGLLAGEFGGDGHADVDLDHVLGSVPASEVATASVAVAPLSVPEPTVPASREPSTEASSEEAETPRPREAAEQARPQSARPSWSLAPEPVDERPAEVAKTAPVEDVRASRSNDTGPASRSQEPGRASRSDEVATASRPEQRESAKPADESVASRSERANAATGSPSDVVRYRRSEPVADVVLKALSDRSRAGSAGRRRAEDKADEVSSRDEVSSEAVAVSRSERADTRASRKTRHDSEHGSVAARSVLDRLGVSTGASGGRRRAPGTGEPGRPEAGGRRRAEDDTPHDSATRAETSGESVPEDVGRDFAGQDSAGRDDTSRESISRDAAGRESAAREFAGRADADQGSAAPEDASRELAGRGGASREFDGREEAGREFGGRGDAGREFREREEASREFAARDDGGSSGESWLSAEAEPVSRADAAPAARADSASEPDVRGENGSAPSMPVIDNWLPRLRLPPSLAPWDDFSDTDSEPATGTSTSETPFTTAPVLQDDDLGEPFRTELTGVPDDDLPEDAGLADLLARALAEHQAGTASAAALVKRLGNQSSSEPRPVNGHGRNGSEPGNGRHRGDG
ncbi:hypothetical protein GCM10017786_29880 [Amycolatopsis deserti]|uniref:Uncharacterized protein n=1 Tax=Amycolatopsis deserti TaxID=185696 RepID=A0ABQ3IUY4_9PSEU|nr:hypothetical protein [Amycolatopsis deserti]GHE94836.1 hypothetical protein GCM10017786_29880 [Amycolatopsis deserti]